MAVLFIPVLFGMSQLYSWARPADVESDPILQQKRWFLNPTFFHGARRHLFRDLEPAGLIC